MGSRVVSQGKKWLVGDHVATANHVQDGSPYAKCELIGASGFVKCCRL